MPAHIFPVAFGKQVYTNDPRCGTIGISAGIVLGKRAEKALQHVPYRVCSDLGSIGRCVGIVGAESTVEKGIIRLARRYVQGWLVNDGGE